MDKYFTSTELDNLTDLTETDLNIMENINYDQQRLKYLKKFMDKQLKNELDKMEENILQSNKLIVAQRYVLKKKDIEIEELHNKLKKMEERNYNLEKRNN